MPTAVAGNTAHYSKTLNIAIASYKFIPLTGNAGDGIRDNLGVGWLKVTCDSTASIYVQPHKGVISPVPTAWTTTPEPAAGAIGEALPILPGAFAEFGQNTSVERGSDEGNEQITGLHVWAKAAGLVGLQGI